MGTLLSKDKIPEIDTFKQEIERLVDTKISYKHNKILEENEYLKNVNKNLENEISKLKQNMIENNGLSLTSLSPSEVKIISEQNITKYIDKILENPETNISWLPDVVERKIYKNITMMLLGVIETTLENSDIKFMGHRIKFVMDPQIKEKEETLLN